MRHFVSVFMAAGATFAASSCGQGDKADGDGDGARQAANSGSSASVSSASANGQVASTSASTGDGASASAESTSRSNGAFSTSRETGLYLFKYSWPPAAGSIPGLDGALTGRMEKARDDLAVQAREASRDADEEGFPYNKHSSDTKWEVVADTPRFLSLSAGVYSYAGGAHPNLVYDTLLWDRQAGRPVNAESVFESRRAFRTMMSEPLCDALNAEREKRRGQPVDPEAEDSSNSCPDMGEVVILLGSSNGDAIDRVGFLFAPYVAGPYAEGSYDVTMPVTPALKGIVKQEYRSAFAVR